MIQASVALVTKVTDLVLALQAMGSALGASSGSLAGVSPADVAAFAGELAGRLAEYALLMYLEGYWPRAFVLLRAIGLVDVIRDPGRPGDPTRPPSLRRSLHLDRLGKLLTSPIEHFETVYGWNSPTFDAQRFIEVVHDVLFMFAIPSIYEPISEGSPIKL